MAGHRAADGGDGAGGDPRSARTGWLRTTTAVAALACELAMLALLALAGWDLGSHGLLSISLAIFYPALAALIWTVWMAPVSTRRLSDPWRFVAQVLLFAATGTLAGLSGHVATGSAFAVLATGVFAAGRRTGAPAC